MAEGRFEYELIADASKAISEVARFTKAQEGAVRRIKAAQDSQVKNNVRVDRSIIRTRAELSKNRAALVRYSKNLTKNGDKAAAAAERHEELSLQLQRQQQELREGKRALTEYNRALDKLQRDAARGIDVASKGLKPSISQSAVPLGPGGAGTRGFQGQVGRRAGAMRGARNLGAQAAALGGAAGSGGLLAPLASGALLQQSVSASVDLSSQRKKLELLSKQYGEYDQVLKIVASSADIFNKSQREATTEFANVFARLRPLGVSLQDIKGVYEGFNTVAVASGATSEATRIAFMQLSQAIGSGRLAGDEFRSVSEQIPGVLIPIAKEMDVTVGELKQLGAEGKITSDVLINALSGSLGMTTEEIKKFIKEQPAGKFKAFSNALSDLAVVVGDALMPVALTLVETLTGMIDIFLRLPKPVQNITGLLGGLGLAFFGVNAAANALNITLSTKLLITIGALAGKIALVLAPLIALGLILEENKQAKESFDEAMKTDDVEVIDAKIQEITKNIASMEQGLQQIEDSEYYKGQAQDASSIKEQLKKAKEQLDLLTGRRELFLDIKFGIQDFDKMGPGFAEELKKELEALGLEYTPGKEVKPLKNKGGGANTAEQLAKTQANNALRLAQKNAQIRLNFVRDEYALRLQLEQSQHRVEEANVVGVARQQLALINARIQSARALEQRQARLDDAVTMAEQRVQAATTRLNMATGVVDRERASGQLALANADLGAAQRNAELFRGAAPEIFQNQSAVFARASAEPFKQQTEDLLLQTEALKQRNRLLLQGVSPELIQAEMAKAEIDRRAGDQLKMLNEDQVGNAEAIRRIKTAAAEAKEALDGLTEAQQQSAGAIGEYISQSMQFVTDIKARIVDIAQVIEDGIAKAIQGVIEGTMTASQAFGEFFRSIAKSFLQMAAQMIAKLIVINLLKRALGPLFNFGSPGFDLNTTQMGDGVDGVVGSMGTYGPNFGFPVTPNANGNVLRGGFQAFANGGVVKSPTLGLIGEGRMNEAVVPLPDGRAIPVDMGKGAAGNVQTNITVNVDQGGNTESDVSGDNANKLGLAINNAVKRVIMDERRAGGLLHNGRR